MEGKGRVPDPAVRPGTVEEFKDTQTGKVLPRFGAEPVKTAQKPELTASGDRLQYTFPPHSFTLLKGAISR